MFCRYCGKEIQDNAKFCRYCGKELQAKVTSNEKQKPEKKKNVVVIVLCVVLCLLLALTVGLTIAKVMRDNKNSTRQEEQDERDRDDDREDEQDENDEKDDKDEKDEQVDDNEDGWGEKASEDSVEVETTVEMTVEASAEAEVPQYILPESDSRYLTKDDLIGFTQEECRIARNELFARHGRIFQDETLQAYFESCDWYQGTVLPEEFDEAVFNEYELANRDLIVEFEKEQGYR